MLQYNPRVTSHGTSICEYIKYLFWWTDLRIPALEYSWLSKDSRVNYSRWYASICECNPLIHNAWPIAPLWFFKLCKNQSFVSKHTLHRITTIWLIFSSENLHSLDLNTFEQRIPWHVVLDMMWNLQLSVTAIQYSSQVTSHCTYSWVYFSLAKTHYSRVTHLQWVKQKECFLSNYLIW